MENNLTFIDYQDNTYTITEEVVDGDDVYILYKYPPECFSVDLSSTGYLIDEAKEKRIALQYGELLECLRTLVQKNKTLYSVSANGIKVFTD